MRNNFGGFKNQQGGGFPNIESRIILFLLMVFFGVFFATYKAHGVEGGLWLGLDAAASLASPIFLILIIATLISFFRRPKNPSKPKDT